MHPGVGKKIRKKCAASQIFYETKCAAGKTYQTKSTAHTEKVITVH